MPLLSIERREDSKKPEDKDVDAPNAVSTVSAMLSPALIPMLEAMADLTLNDTTQALAAV
jgi:hypothetical protein